jgi:hypothetical protein
MVLGADLQIAPYFALNYSGSSFSDCASKLRSLSRRLRWRERILFAQRAFYSQSIYINCRAKRRTTGSLSFGKGSEERGFPQTEGGTGDPTRTAT